MKRFLKQFTTYILILALFVVQGVSIVRAQEAPPPPPEAPSAPSAPSAPTWGQDSAGSNWDNDNNDEEDHDDWNNDDEEENDESQSQEQPAVDGQTAENIQSSGDSDGSGNVGDTEIETGDATSTGSISNVGNLNTSGDGCCDTGGATVINSGNGEDSTNTGSATIYNSDNTTQDNSATVVNDLDQSSTTGSNEASDNVGNSSIDTGDANVSGTIVNAVNTNIDGVAVAEFNIVDDHMGDIILDFGNSNCIVGCGSPGDTTVENTENGSDSSNTGEVTTTSEDNTFQTNDATVENNMTLLADSGDNDASANTGGDSTIETGDASVAANILNAVNSNIAGNVIVGVVNIFGDLIGDIILPDNPFANCSTCTAANITAANTGNGSDSTNEANVTEEASDNTFQYNDATIENNVIVDATTGDNSASRNTGGSSTIETGDIDVDVQILNIANSNISGADWWLVIVNEAGQWIGRILGAPDGQNFAGGAGTEFVVDPVTGEITAMNTGNGSDSTNNANVTNENYSTTEQTNTANIVNNLDLTANTGGNSTNDNTGGDNSIKTGDAHVIANIINFVNNNIAGNGRLFVTVVNVFGSWIGDLVAPGQEKQNNSENLAAGTDSENSNNSDNGVGGNSNNNSNNSDNSNSNTNSNSNSNGGSNTQVSGQISIGANISSNDGNGSPEGEVLVAQTNSNDSGILAGEEQVKSVTVNLAWILLLTVPFSIFLVLRRKFGFINSVIAKGIHLIF